VGGHLAATLASEHEVVALGRSNLDITEKDSVRRIVNDLRPGLIYNCAVLQVDDSELNPNKAEAVNVSGPRYLAEAANDIGAVFVQFSTQYAFEGEPDGRAPYTIEDAPRPVNIYGKTKVAGEGAVRDACARSHIIRTSWVYGKGKNSFLCAAPNDLKVGKKVHAIDDIWSSTTYVEDLIRRVQVIVDKRRYGTYHVVNAGVCSYYDFALEAGRLLGLDRSRVDALVEITHERDMKRVAARPRYTPLRCLLSEELGLPPMRGWRDALAAYVRA